MLKRIGSSIFKEILGGGQRRAQQAQGHKGLLLYASIQDVLATHAAMKRYGMEVSLVPPPLAIALGCDLAIQFEPAEEEVLRSMLHQGVILPGKIHLVEQPIPAIANLVSVQEITPGFLMATSYNIKVTIELTTREIVNVSGGGCPDIPYVARQLVGAQLETCPEPVNLGSSLCTYMLQLAVDGLRQEVSKVC